jgi:hypothetical protein
MSAACKRGRCRRRSQRPCSQSESSSAAGGRGRKASISWTQRSAGSILPYRLDLDPQAHLLAEAELPACVYSKSERLKVRTASHRRPRASAVDDRGCTWTSRLSAPAAASLRAASTDGAQGRNRTDRTADTRIFRHDLGYATDLNGGHGQNRAADTWIFSPRRRWPKHDGCAPGRCCWVTVDDAGWVPGSGNREQASHRFSPADLCSRTRLYWLLQRDRNYPRWVN